ncbi:MAG: hypothetical protein WC551_06735 [Patescibacteria group bacterium]
MQQNSIRAIVSNGFMGLILALTFLPAAVSAASTPVAGQSLDTIAAKYKFEDQMGGKDIPQIVARIISWVLPVTGSLLLLMFLYGGFLWFTAGGSAEQVKKATQTMTNAVIGMAIIVGAYAIVNTLIMKFGAAIGGTP